MPREYFNDFPVCSTIKELILDGFARGGNKRQFLFRDEKGIEHEKSFAEVRKDTLALAAFLRLRGIGKGDRVAVLSENSYFWNAAYYAGQVNGSVILPLDAALPAEDLFGQMAKAGTRAVFCSEKQKEKADFALSQTAGPLEFVFCETEAEAFYEEGENAPQKIKDALLSETAAPDDLACVVFTSGTTGKTKGVMLTNKNVCSNVYALLHVATGGHGIGFLPLNHTYSWVTGLFATLVKSEWGYICTGLHRIYKDIKTYKPYQFAAVPMVVEMIYQNIVLTAKRKGTYETLLRGIETSKNFMLSGYDARREIFSEIHEALGGNLECIFCGGAYLSPEIEEFMFNIGIQIRTGYGLTECSPAVTAGTRYEYKFGSVGLPLECNEVMIHDPDENGVGEIRVRGDNVTPGYYNDPEATAAAFENGWLKTGDRGYLDADGYLFFTGRSKNLIILSNGKNVSPEELEGRLTARIPCVKEALIYEKDRRICAEVYLNEDEYPDARDTLPAQIEAFNDTLADYMQIGLTVIRDDPFPKTSTMKIKRQ